MAKKLSILICIFSVLLVKQVNSQVLIGLLFGEALNKGPIEFGLNIIGNHSTTTINNGSTYKRKLGFGLYLDYKITDRLILSGAFFFSSPKGEAKFNETDPLYNEVDTLLSGATTERQLNYFEFPVVFDYRPFKMVGVGVGGYIAYLSSAHDYYKVTMPNDQGDVVHKISVLSQMNRFDYGVIAAAHFHFKGDPGSQIQFKYMYGLADLLKDGGNGNGRNETFQLGVMIPIKFGIASSDRDEAIEGSE